MGRTRDLFKKIRDTKGTFHANMGSTKDRNGMDLTEAMMLAFRRVGWTDASETWSRDSLSILFSFPLSSS